MDKLIKFELHCHSNFSDGILAPDELAVLMSLHNVKYAALTDHNSIGGCMNFKENLSKYNIKFITGTELNVEISNNKDIHLLMYGFDINNPLIHDILESIKGKFINDKDKGNNSSLKLTSNEYIENIKNIIRIFHDAGGYAFLAHPLVYFNDTAELENLIFTLNKNGLDGIECYFKPYSNDEISYLVNLAYKYDMLIAGGSDFHNNRETSYTYEFPAINKSVKITEPGIDIPFSHIRRTIEKIIK